MRLRLLERSGGTSRDIAAAYKRLKTPLSAGPCTIRLDLDCQPVKIEYDGRPFAVAS